jgi:SAM-dependent methyltransferase
VSWGRTDRRPGRRRTGSPPPPPIPARERFRAADEYRAAREWSRNEGTVQRALFRELRIRFLRRHTTPAGWALDVGAGPGRFTPFVGGPDSQRVALDLSRAMLLEMERRQEATSDGPRRGVERVVGDALRPPFRAGAFGEVAAIGNVIGFAEEESDRMLHSVESLVEAGGTLVVEVAPGPGERSRYLHRLPPTAVARMLAAPRSVLLGRVEREGFAAGTPRRGPTAFRRVSPSELTGRWQKQGWTVRETMSVAPALGSDPLRIQAAWTDPLARSRLLDLEEEVGHRPERWPGAAAVLLAATAPPLRHD